MAMLAPLVLHEPTLKIVAKSVTHDVPASVHQIHGESDDDDDEEGEGMHMSDCS